MVNPTFYSCDKQLHREDVKMKDESVLHIQVRLEIRSSGDLSGLVLGTHASSQSNFFHFNAVFGNKLLINQLAPLKKS